MNNKRFEEMLAQEGADLTDDVQALVKEIERVNRERDEQTKRYTV